MTDMVGLFIVFMIKCPHIQKRFLIKNLFQTHLGNNIHIEFIMQTFIQYPSP